MKILSYNIRGLGGILKKKEIREVIEKERVDFVCIQETKKDAIDRKLVESIWRYGEVDWVYAGAMGKSGGC